MATPPNPLKEALLAHWDVLYALLGTMRAEREDLTDRNLEALRITRHALASLMENDHLPATRGGQNQYRREWLDAVDRATMILLDTYDGALTEADPAQRENHIQKIKASLEAILEFK